jgi:hypothetical protein
LASTTFSSFRVATWSLVTAGSPPAVPTARTRTGRLPSRVECRVDSSLELSDGCRHSSLRRRPPFLSLVPVWSPRLGNSYCVPNPGAKTLGFAGRVVPWSVCFAPVGGALCDPGARGGPLSVAGPSVRLLLVGVAVTASPAMGCRCVLVPGVVGPTMPASRRLLPLPAADDARDVCALVFGIL